MKIAVLTVLASMPAFAGFWIGERMKYRRKAVSAWIRFLEAIDREIRCFLRPAGDIFRSYSDPFLEKAGFLPRLKAESALMPTRALERAAEETLPRMIRDRDATDVLLNFCRRFGALPKEEQLKDLSDTIGILRGKEKEWMTKEAADVRLARTLGCAAGIALLILLW